ncbi:MAG: Phosphoglycerate kinase [Alphaproteobacteria bacterium MarineAlpha11_Bin1]|nr:MAG: Phosphoglycerate kinase [Alphaproteobacteria bacterium MarineAlpha11_Bin1]|tara:strand:+ start:9435 stop:10622 length:1188 start_codon:yes stop_codon:yes gene_type:complete
MLKTIDYLDVYDKKVFLRADLNVPMSDGNVTDSTRIDRIAPTVMELVDKGAIVIVASHFGRPMGERHPDMSLEPLAGELSRALGGRNVSFAHDCIGPHAKKVVNGAKRSEIVLLENLRYHAGEEANDPDFAKQLSSLVDVYVNDAFSAAHRAHASTDALAGLLPAAAGRLMQAELEALDYALGNPERPVGAIVGGSKISTKIDLLGNLVEKVDMLAIGGAMANTFLHALETDIGKSVCEHDMADTALQILGNADEAGCQIILPSDAAVSAEFAKGAPSQVVPTAAIPSDMMILDVGPGSANSLAVKLNDLKTLVWNGPLGAFEIPPFDAGTVMVAKVAADLTRSGLLKTVAGGGDTVAALALADVLDEFSYVSTAGGAFLEWLEGKELPGVKALG